MSQNKSLLHSLWVQLLSVGSSVISSFSSTHVIKSSSPVWLLGNIYQALSLQPSPTTVDFPVDEEEFKKLETQRKTEIELDFYSRIWFSYRRGFPPVDGADGVLTSDAGWGCMLRSIQMTFAQALICHYITRDWRYYPDKRTAPIYAQILRWFHDSPSLKSPFSIHNLVYAYSRFDKPLGSWFGPSEACRALKDSLASSDIDSIGVVISDDGVLYRDIILEECHRCPPELMEEEKIQQNQRDLSENVKQTTSTNSPAQLPSIFNASFPSSIYDSYKSSSLESNTERQTQTYSRENQKQEKEGNLTFSSNFWRPIVLFIPIRLGLKSINPDYIPSLLASFTFSQSIGVAGGKPMSSLFFVGFQDDRVLYLDPHTVQEVTPSQQDYSYTSVSYHCSRIRSMPVANLDPSMALAFYCKSADDFEDFWSQAEEMVSVFQYPVFRVAERCPSYLRLLHTAQNSVVAVD